MLTAKYLNTVLRTSQKLTKKMNEHYYITLQKQSNDKKPRRVNVPGPVAIEMNQLRQENKELHDEIKILKSALADGDWEICCEEQKERMRNEIEQLSNALRQYADHKNWNCVDNACPACEQHQYNEKVTAPHNYDWWQLDDPGYTIAEKALSKENV